MTRVAASAFLPVRASGHWVRRDGDGCLSRREPSGSDNCNGSAALQSTSLHALLHNASSRNQISRQSRSIRRSRRNRLNSCLLSSKPAPQSSENYNKYQQNPRFWANLGALEHSGSSHFATGRMASTSARETSAEKRTSHSLGRSCDNVLHDIVLPRATPSADRTSAIAADGTVGFSAPSQEIPITSNRRAVKNWIESGA